MFSTSKCDASKIERGRGLGVAKESNIAKGNNEYTVGNDGNNNPLAEGNDDKDYKPRMAILLITMTSTPLVMTVSMSPLPRAMMTMILSVPPVREPALRVSLRACPHAESIIL